MALLTKAAIAMAATSLIVAPVAASAATGASAGFDGATAVSATSGQSELEGNWSWLIGLAGLLAGLTAMILIADDQNDDDPVSP